MAAALDQADQANVTDRDTPMLGAGRAVVSDPPGAPSMLTLYSADQALAARRRYGRPGEETDRV